MFSLPSRLPSAPAFSDAPLHHECRCASATDRAKTKHDGVQSRNARPAVCLSLHESRRPRNFARHPCAATQRIAQFFFIIIISSRSVQKNPKTGYETRTHRVPVSHPSAHALALGDTFAQITHADDDARYTPPSYKVPAPQQPRDETTPNTGKNPGAVSTHVSRNNKTPTQIQTLEM